MSGLAKTILMIAKESIKINDHSAFLQTSFRKYQWRESLLLCLATLTTGFDMKDSKIILTEMEELCRQPCRTSRINPRKLVQLISDRNMIPMAVKPHSIFFLSSEDNFIAACFDWLLLSIEETKEMDVSNRLSLATSDVDRHHSSNQQISKACIVPYADSMRRHGQHGISHCSSGTS